MSKLEFIPDSPLEQKYKELERNNAILVERIIKMEDRITHLENQIKTGEKDLGDIKTMLSDNFRTRNMIIRSYSKTGLVSKFMPE